MRDTKKIDKISFMINKTISKVRELNLIRGIYTNSIINTIFNGKILNPFILFPQRSEMRQRCPPFPFLFNIALEILARAVG